MPSEHVVVRTCDACFYGLEQRTIAVATFSIGIATGEAKPTVHVVEACELHRKPIDELLALIRQTQVLPINTGVAPTAPPRGPYAPRESGDFSTPRDNCPICDKETARSAVANHIWSAHLGRSAGRPKQPVQCPDCEYNNVDGAAMGQHRGKMHRYNGIEEAVAIFNHRASNPTPPPPATAELELFEDEVGGTAEIADAPPAEAPARAPRRSTPRAEKARA